MNNEGIDHLNRKQGSLTPWRDLVVKTQGRFYTACGPNSPLLSCSTAYKQASGLLTNMDNCRHYTMFANGWIFTPDRQR